jgi:hypothetical protein
VVAMVKARSIAHIDSLAAGGGADNEQGERAEEASLHGRCSLKVVGQAGQDGPAEKGLVGRPAECNLRLRRSIGGKGGKIEQNGIAGITGVNWGSSREVFGPKT